MTEQKPRVVAIGEVMIELARGNDGRFGMACGGDTFNTAVYLARAGIDVSYATALGDDPYSDSMVAMAAAEGVKTDLMLRVPGRLPGLYIIETDAKGERRFRYWRGEAPARELFELPDWNRIAESMMGAKLIYFSGITLSLYSNIGLGRLLAIVEMARQQGAKVAFDGNFRPHGWKGDLPRTRTVFMEALKRVDYRAADLRRRGGAVGRSEPGGDGRAAAGVRHRRDRGEERPEQRAGRGRADSRSTCRCRRSCKRSTPRRRATASTPAISRRGSPARARPRRRSPDTRLPRRRCAIAARSCRATSARCISSLTVILTG